MKEKIRILHILPALNFCGGMENYVMNYYRKIDRNKIQFDFITHTDLENSFKNEVKVLGGKIYEFPVFKMGKIFSIIKLIDRFFFEHKNDYKIIHCHMANAAYFYFKIAKKYGINIRILHSHQPSSADKITHKIRNYPLLFLGNKLATHRVACTKLAGEFLFRHKDFIVIKNAIDINKFKFNIDKRNKLRKELGLENKFVIGHIGRFCAQKNQMFLLEIFKGILNKEKNSYLIMIGNGEDKEKIKNQVKIFDLLDKVKILPPCKNVNDYYQIFDAFVFPSLYEGLGIVLIEAQCVGLKTYTSIENMPVKDLNITNLISFISLNDGVEKWVDRILKDKANTIINNRIINYRNIIDNGYDINYESILLEKYYMDLLRGCQV